jgi:hypothetical protein
MGGMREKSKDIGTIEIIYNFRDSVMKNCTGMRFEVAVPLGSFGEARSINKDARNIGF